MATEEGTLLPPMNSELLLDIIGKHFIPASHAGDASLMLTSDELHTKLQELAPQEFSPLGLRAALQELGYAFINLEGQFRWLLKER